MLDELTRLRDAIVLPAGERPVGPGAHDFPHLVLEGNCPVRTGVQCYVGVAQLSPESTDGPWVDYNRAVGALMDRVLEEVERGTAP